MLLDPDPVPVPAVGTVGGATGAFPVADETTGSVLNPDGKALAPLATVTVGVTVTVIAGVQAVHDCKLPRVTVETTIEAVEDIEAGSSAAPEVRGRVLEHFFLLFEDMIAGSGAASEEDGKTLEHFFLLFEAVLVGKAPAADDAVAVTKELSEPEAKYAASEEEALVFNVRVGNVEEAGTLVAMGSATEEMTIEEPGFAEDTVAMVEDGIATLVELTMEDTLKDGAALSPPEPETEVVRSPPSTYTPLKYQSTGASSVVKVAPGRRSTPTCQSAPFLSEISLAEK